MNSEQNPYPEQRLLSDSTGACFTVKCNRHFDVCWHCEIHMGAQRIGYLQFEPKDAQTIELADIKIDVEFRGRRIGSTLFRYLCSLWRLSQYQRVEGVIMAEDADSKEKVVAWYKQLGAGIVRDDDAGNPRLAGSFRLEL